MLNRFGKNQKRTQHGIVDVVRFSGADVGSKDEYDPPLSIAAASNCANSCTWVVKFPAMALTESLERKKEYVVSLRSEMVGEEDTYVISCQIP
jgi:hypothetical protein